MGFSFKLVRAQWQKTYLILRLAVVEAIANNNIQVNLIACVGETLIKIVRRENPLIAALYFPKVGDHARTNTWC